MCHNLFDFYPKMDPTVEVAFSPDCRFIEGFSNCLEVNLRSYCSWVDESCCLVVDSSKKKDFDLCKV